MTLLSELHTRPAPAPFTAQQHNWLHELVIPGQVCLMFASEFDDHWLQTSGERWTCRYSGMNIVLDFRNSAYCRELSPLHIRLLKYLLIRYISEHAATVLYSLFTALSRFLSETEAFTHSSIIARLNMLSADKKQARNFFLCLYACRKLDACGFFSSTDGDNDIEDKLLFVQRPLNNSKDKIYSDIENILPSSVCTMIENGLQEWSSRFTPSLSSTEQKQQHLHRLSQTLNINALRDCVILGLLYTTGARPVQLSALAASDFSVDASSDSLTRFSVKILCAKKIKVTTERIAVALADELGKLIFLYIKMAGLSGRDPLFPQHLNAVSVINSAITRQLLRFSSDEMQNAVQAGLLLPPEYTASMFRHHVGHSMAMAGAGAEEIAYVLGHSSTITAGYYISATPELASVRENALGTNPVFRNMIALMMTGNLTSGPEWTGRKAAGSVGQKLHYYIGGCNNEFPSCPFSPVRACYGCLYFRPFIDGHHQDVFNSLNDEIIALMKLSDDTHLNSHPLIPELTRRKKHVMQVMTRIRLYKHHARSTHERTTTKPV